ncbi:MAG TPA: bifunctional homocysteine S-methyltransferase/methylenetetrahydrofolate reductase [Ktedonobacterales bacterium]|nr:bifunctional homocysteine S-methyltransferase/methylenetetrahydrofolate reductase [Ktedonobacterales bacterium]
MSEPFLDRLRQGPLLCDGAMGTVLYARAPESVMHGRCFDELVLTDPGLVQRIHGEYIAAGAQVIETNTFGANAAKLANYGLADQVRTINRRATQLAREAREIAGQPVFVAGAVGPTGAPNVGPAAADDTRLAALRATFRAQIEALIEGGADLLILETFSNPVELRQAVLAAREAGDLPIVAQMTFSEDGQSASGASPLESALALASLGVCALGGNCGIGPAGTLDAVNEMAAALRTLHDGDEIFLSAQPNAGLPVRVENRFLYVSTPPYFADYARRFADAGVRLIGGCCGTTPAHIAAMRAALADYLPDAQSSVWTAPSLAISRPADLAAVSPVAGESETPCTRLQAELAAGNFAVSIELDPPKGLNPTKILDGAAHLKRLGVQFINVADSPMARVRMSCLALARLLRDHLDLEPVIHFTTRDRNLMAIQSDLLGAHALGVHNILALTGDPLHAGNYPNLTGVWDVDSVGLIRILRGMNDGYDAAGAALGMPARFHIGAALNLNMEDALIDLDRERARRKLSGSPADSAAGAGDAGDIAYTHPHLTETELELRRLRHKLDAGARYIMTQPIYDLEPLERFRAAFGPVDVPIILGMIPLHSTKHAEYLHNEVPGITIPAEVRARMREAGERGREVGIQLAHDVIAAARDRGLIQGCYLMPSYGRYDLVGELAQELLRTARPPARSRA